MKATLTSLVLGYLLGTLSPAKLISRRKNTDLKESGTGNLGATNTMLVFGLRYGVFVMLFDILKSIMAVRLAKWLFPKSVLAGLLAGCGAVVGHIYPFYLKFKGGKGIAALAGLILACDPVLFPVLLGIGIVLSLLTDYAVATPISAALLFPVFEGLRTGSLVVFGLLLSMGILIVMKHIVNLERIRDGEEIHVRAYFGEKLKKLSSKEQI